METENNNYLRTNYVGIVFSIFIPLPLTIIIAALITNTPVDETITDTSAMMLLTAMILMNAMVTLSLPKSEEKEEKFDLFSGMHYTASCFFVGLFTTIVIARIVREQLANSTPQNSDLLLFIIENIGNSTLYSFIAGILCNIIALMIIKNMTERKEEMLLDHQNS